MTKSKNKRIKIFNITIVVCLLLAILSFLLLIYFTEFNNIVGDLLVNLCAAFFSVFLSSFFINLISEIKSYKEKEPYYIKRYKDIYVLLNQYISLYGEIYKCVNPKVDKVKRCEFLSKTLNEAVHKLDKSKKCPIDTSLTWNQYIFYKYVLIQKDINNILRSYSVAMDFDLFNLLDSMNSHISQISKYKSEIKIKKTKCSFFINYSLSDEKLKTINDLIEWCDKEYIRLKNNKLIKIQPFPNEITLYPLRENPLVFDFNDNVIF